MRLFRPVAKAALCLSALFAFTLVPAAVAGDQDFTVVNATGVEIAELYVSTHNTKVWEEDILGEDTLANGTSVEISFSTDETAKMWDLKIVDGSDNSITWENLNLLEISKVTLHFKDGRAWADTE